MSINDRLGEAMTAAEACMADRPADPNAVELAMRVPDLVAAVRAVLDVCDRIDASIIPSGDFEVGQKSVTQTIRMIVERRLSTAPRAADSAHAIATALGCGDGIDTSQKRVHETPKSEHIQEARNGQ